MFLPTRSLTALISLLSCLFVAAPGLQAAARVPAPAVDIPKVINASYGLLRDREPVMTDVEFSLYQRLVPMIFDRPQFAITMLETMLKDDQPESPAFTFALANVYFSAGRVEAAQAQYEAALKAYPSFLRAWQNLGMLHYQQGRFDEAVNCLTRARQLGDTEPQTLQVLAYCLTRTDEPIAAEAVYLQALSVSPRDRECIQGLLALYIDTAQWSRAEPLVRDLVRLEPQSARDWRAYASILDHQGRTGEAAVVLDIAARSKALDDAGWLQLGDLYFKQRMYAEAIDAYGHPAAGGDPVALSRLVRQGTALVARGRLDEAQAVLDRLPAGGDDASTAERNMLQARLAMAREQWPEAVALLEAAERLRPRQGELLLLLGEARMKTGEDAQAEVALKAAAREPATRYQACLGLANLALMRKDYQAAAASLQDALNLRDDDNLRRNLRAVRALISQQP